MVKIRRKGFCKGDLLVFSSQTRKEIWWRWGEVAAGTCRDSKFALTDLRQRSMS